MNGSRGVEFALSLLALVRNFGLSLGKTTAAVGANVVFVMATARAFSHEQVAVLAVAGIAAMLMDACKGLGLGQVVLRKLPRLEAGDPAAGELVRSLLFYSLLAPAAIAAAGLLFPEPVSRYFFGSASHSGAIRLSMIAGLFTVLTNTNLIVLQARRQFAPLAGITVASTVLQRIVPCLTLLDGPTELDRFLLWGTCGAILGFLASCFPLAGDLLAQSGRRIIMPSDFWHESRHFWYSSLLRYTTTQVDQLFVAALFPPATLAVYYMLRRLYSIGVLLIASLLEALAPELSEQAGSDMTAARARLSGWLKVVLYTGTIVAAVLAGHGGSLIAMLLGPGYGSDPLLITLFAISAVTYFLHGFVQMDLALFHDPRRTFRMALATAAANWMAGPIASIWLGVHSIPLAMIAGHVLGLVIPGGGGTARVWQPAHMLVSLTSISLTAVVSIGAQQWSGTPAGWVRWFAVNFVVAAFSWTQYSSWQMSACWRRLAPPAA